MRNKLYRLLAAVIALLPLAAQAQDNSSLNTFSPYTFYGLGDLQQAGTVRSHSMGGIGVAIRNWYEVNPLNPASYSAVPRQSAAFTVGLSGKNTYLKTDAAKTAHNSFNINNIGFMLPITRGVGFAVTVNPYSSVGYRAHREETDPEIITDVGYVLYSYQGEGNISQVKAGIGAQLFPGFSLGADVIGYLGTINRYSGVEISTVTSDAYSNITINDREEVSDISFGVGFQYNVWTSADRRKILTVGATYEPKLGLHNKSIREVISSRTTDSIRYSEMRNTITIPQKFSGGIYYQVLAKGGIGLDYTYQDWNKAFTIPSVDRVTLRRSQSINFGFEYTPNAGDIRNFLNRWTYRAGFKYADMYLVKDGQKINNMAVTLGVGVPLSQFRMGEMSVGLEFGRRGKTGFTPNNLPMVRENYFKVSLGFTLFDDYWFIKQRYD